MSVYVDDMEADFGRMKMSHMVADTHAELIEMVDRIGVATRWIQQAGTAQEHFDIAKNKKKLAVSLGAIEITWTELAKMTFERRGEGMSGYFPAALPECEVGE